MTITQSNYLDIGNLFFNEIVGSVFLGYILVLAIIVFLSIKFRVPNTAMFALIVIWSMISAQYAFNDAIITIVVLLAGLVIYLVYSKMIKRS